MTPSAKYADLLLPETSFMERWNIGETRGTASYLILSEKLIEPEFERRSDYDWLREVAAKLGIENEFSRGRDEKAWIEHIWEQTRGDAGRKSTGFRHAAKDPSASVQKRAIYRL